MGTHTWTHLAWAGPIWLITLASSVALGWGITVLVLRLARVRQENTEIPARDGHAHLLPEHEPTRRVLRGGLWIGILERMAVTAAILAATPELIAVVVAVKGLGRYPELKENPAASEKFLIGTGTSLLVAAAAGGIGRFILLSN